jgi:hypothetical protein
MINKTLMTVIVSVILTILIVALVNVGLSIFLVEPTYDKFCGSYNNYIAKPIPMEINSSESLCSEDTKTCENGRVLSRDSKLGCEFPSCTDKYKTCQEEFENEMKDYNQIKYYVFAAIGFILLLIGLFIYFNMFQLTGLFSGGILLFEGILFNFKNKTLVFISLLIILIVFGIASWRILDKNQGKERK